MEKGFREDLNVARSIEIFKQREWKIGEMDPFG